MEYFVEIVNYENDEVVESIPCGTSERKAEKVDRGVNINLNHTEYFTRIKEKK